MALLGHILYMAFYRDTRDRDHHHHGDHLYPPKHPPLPAYGYPLWINPPKYMIF